MPNVTRIVYKREKRREWARHNYLGWAGLSCSALLSLSAALGVVALVLTFNSLTQGLPSLESLPALLDPPVGLLLQPTRLYDRSGEHLLLTLQNPAAAGGQYLPVEHSGSHSPVVQSSQEPALPGILISATLANADPTFWSHPGFFLDGRSTLAQRLVSDLLLWNEPASLRKAVRERLLAAQLTARFGRQQVLEWYLNSAHYGRLAYGADAAAHLYFGKSASDLSLSEAALLAASAEAPALNPLDAPQASLERQQRLILSMRDLGLIREEQAAQALREPPLISPTQGFNISSPVLGQGTAQILAGFVLDQAGGEIQRARLERGGLQIITTLDYDLQLQAECATATQLARLAGLSVEQPATDGSACQSARLLPGQAGLGDQLFPGLAGEVMILAPQTGEILALVGSPASGSSRLSSHAPGSLLTPFIYLTAFTQGMGPASLVWDVPGALPEPGMQNFDGQFHGPLRLRMALANDYLIPVARVLAQTGPENVLRTARQMGLSSVELSSQEEAVFGRMTLLEASQAFGVFANQGLQAGRVIGPEEAPANQVGALPGLAPLSAVVVKQVKDGAGRVWLEWSSSQLRPVISTQLAYLVTDILSDETARRPSLGHPNHLEVGRPAAVKPGRTMTGYDTWTVGYTPQLVVGVWLGTERRPDSSQAPAGTDGAVSGEASPALPPPPGAASSLWHAIFQYASRGLPPQGWTPPPGINQLIVCDPSGMLPTTSCPATVREVFLAGSEPVQADSLYQTLQINRATGRLATVFTPNEWVDERVYLIVPPEARQWAQEAGIALPPEDYDLVSASPSTAPDVRINSPEMFAYVRGQVPILGQAGGEEFEFYRVQVGKGLKPREWLQVGENAAQPVSDGQLAVWDTSGLNGLFAVQLQVVRSNRLVETAVIQVAVDNQPPEALILYPDEGQVVSPNPSGRVTLRAKIEEELALSSVAFFMDDRPIAALRQGPFTVAWEASTGKHILRVEATDLAGNSNSAEVNFEVR